MKVFISWSGHRSHEVAEALSGWLKKVVQSAEPWVSSDVERGVKWLTEISKSLDAHSIGILCVTPGNVSAPWLNFEAGALSKQLGETGRVIPYLLDFHSPSELQPPLGQFNASLADELGTHDLVKTLNGHSESNLNEADLNETFKMWWPSLRDKLETVRTSGSEHTPRRRTTDDKIDELLDLTRQLIRQVPASGRLANPLTSDVITGDTVRLLLLEELMQLGITSGDPAVEAKRRKAVEVIIEKYSLDAHYVRGRLYLNGSLPYPAIRELLEAGVVAERGAPPRSDA